MISKGCVSKEMLSITFPRTVFLCWFSRREWQWQNERKGKCYSLEMFEARNQGRHSSNFPYLKSKWNFSNRILQWFVYPTIIFFSLKLMILSLICFFTISKNVACLNFCNKFFNYRMYFRTSVFLTKWLIFCFVHLFVWKIRRSGEVGERLILYRLISSLNGHNS